MKRITGLSLFFLLSTLLNAQHQNNWHFGNNAGITFSGDSVSNIVGAFQSFEGTASISDHAGNLLFSTDGRVVYDKNLAPMPNGLLKTSCPGLCARVSQVVIIVNDPGNPNRYYVVHHADRADSVYYSVVDISLAGNGDLSTPLGDVTASKNIFLEDSTTNHLSAIKYGGGYWILMHRGESRDFIAYQLTSSGMSAEPTISSVGPYCSSLSDKGAIKSNYRGDRIALGLYPISLSSGNSGLYLFDFDTISGIVNNTRTVRSSGGFYGVEFSSNSNFLYGSDDRDVWQCNGRDGSQAMIVETSSSIGYSQMQLGPDGRIYAAVFNFSSTGRLGVINCPNLKGAACDFQSNGFATNRATYAGLPQFFSFDQPPLGPPTSVAICQGDSALIGDGYAKVPGNYLGYRRGCRVDTPVVVALSFLNNINTSVSVNSHTLTAMESGSGVTYKWVDCNNPSVPLLEAASQSFKPSTTGSYAVIISKNGCSVSSSCEYVAFVGINDIPFSNIRLYPNPTNGNLNIDFGSALNDIELTVSNVVGKQLTLQYFKTPISKTAVNLEALPVGVYWLTIKNRADQSSRTIKVLKN